MKKNNLILFITAQIIILLAQIHKHSSFVQQAFALQRAEKAAQELRHKKNVLQQKIHQTINLATIEQKALAHGMQKLSLKNIRQLSQVNNE